MPPGTRLPRDTYAMAASWMYLAVEKMLNAHVVKTTETVPPKTHNLLRLAELGQVACSKEQDVCFRNIDLLVMMKHGGKPHEQGVYTR